MLTRSTASPAPHLFVRALHFATSLVDQTRLPFAKLARQFASHAIDRHVQIIRGFLRIDILAGDRQVYLGAKPFLGIDRVIVNEDHVRGDDLGKFFQFTNHSGDMLVKSGGKTEMTGAKMDLHEVPD